MQYGKYTTGHSFGKGFFVCDADGNEYYVDHPKYKEVWEEVNKYRWDQFVDRVTEASPERRLELIDKMEKQNAMYGSRIEKYQSSCNTNGLKKSIESNNKKIEYIRNYDATN